MVRAFRTESLVDAVPQLKRGRVWCRKCRFTISVDSAQCLATGWPKCCGQTMTIDAPTSEARDEE
jgi:hypothetical protein